MKSGNSITILPNGHFQIQNPGGQQSKRDGEPVDARKPLVSSGPATSATKKDPPNAQGGQLRPKTASIDALGKKDSLQIVVQQEKQAKGVKMQGKRATGTAVNFDLKSENPYGQLQPVGVVDRQQQITRKNSRNEQTRLAQRTEHQERPKKGDLWQHGAGSERRKESSGPADRHTSS